MSKVLVSESNLTAIGDAIREKNGESTKYKPGEMATAISAIETGGYITIEGSANGFLKDTYWFNRITNNPGEFKFGSFYNANGLLNIGTNAYSTGVIPLTFELANTKGYSTCSFTSFAQGSNYLKELPTIIGQVKASTFNYAFQGCYYLRNVDDFFNNNIIANETDGIGSDFSNIFNSCYSLRHVPDKILQYMEYYNGGSAVETFYNGMCQNCYVVDELVGVPVHTKTALTSNKFSNFYYCYRLKDFTFKTNNGEPVVAQWKSQVIDMSKFGAGLVWSRHLSNYNSGITEDKQITDDATYAALKNDPDWWSTAHEYSRYDKASAIRTINSLPDTSAYLAEAGGTNTIKFKGIGGQNTDGGAINTMTEAEIAVATAKGWTVSFV